MNLMFAVEQNIKQNDGNVPTHKSPRITQGKYSSVQNRHSVYIG
jgi:hypothetical protein